MTVRNTLPIFVVEQWGIFPDTLKISKMNTYTFTKDENPKICRLIIDLYMWLMYRKPFNLYSQELCINRHRVYDHLGMVDTLGSDSDKYGYSWLSCASYSDELTSTFTITLLGMSITVYE